METQGDRPALAIHWRRRYDLAWLCYLRALPRFTTCDGARSPIGSRRRSLSVRPSRSPWVWRTSRWIEFASGAALGFVLTFPLYALGGFGGGDLKLVVALGAALGPLALLSTLFWMALCGGVLACVAWLRGRRNLAYVPAIALGLLIYWIHLEFVGHAAMS